MKKTILTVLLTAGLPLSAMAAPPAPDAPPKGPAHAHCNMPSPPNGMGPMSHGMQNLTPEQHAKMREIMQAQGMKRQEITKKYLDKLSAPEKKAMQDELAQSKEDASKAMRAILTPEQQKNFDEQKRKRDERMKEWQEFQAWKASKEKK